MKKIAIVGAAGRQGTCLVNEAVARGYEVTGFVRNAHKIANPKAKTVVKDLFDITADDLKEFDVVIDAFGAWTAKTLPLHITSLQHLCDLLSNSKIRLLVVGGGKETMLYGHIFPPLRIFRRTVREREIFCSAAKNISSMRRVSVRSVTRIMR